MFDYSFTKDILLKAASDVERGLWCQGTWFTDEEQDIDYTDDELFTARGSHVDKTLEQVHNLKRCAGGSLAYATAILGGSRLDYQFAKEIVSSTWFQGEKLEVINDGPSFEGVDAFEAGQRWAEIFRDTVNKLP